jgi:hypothetical protein
MTTFRRFWYFVTRWRRLDDLRDEMQLHVEMREAANRRRGLAPGRPRARRGAGSAISSGFVRVATCGASQRWNAWAKTFHAVRQLVHRSTWTVVVVLTLALGIGANIHLHLR